MSQLFARLYLDENVDVIVKSMLRSLGFEALTARDVANLGLGDDEQLEFAVSQGMTMVTHNRADFQALHEDYRSQGRKHWGIVIAADRPPREMVNRLARLLDRLTAEEMSGQLFYI